MTTKLQKARSTFNNELEYLCDKFPELSKERFDEDGFEKFAERIADSRLKVQFCRAAVTLLQENILEHLSVPPSLSELKSASAIRELREWRETLVTWEAALHAMQRLGDA
jgi:hypothetical protein